MPPPVIKVEGLAKEYFLGATAASNMLREQIATGFRRLVGKGPNASKGRERFWALRGISFQVDQGEVIGIIGHNGAGKTTLLKILSEITEPTLGEIQVRGRIASLLEVGTGFHPELTGRENIYLNGAILGMTRAEIKSKFDEIVAFSGVETFLDTPVKRYSSGMYVRLAFSVAAHLEPEVLVVDEVLAVGDLEFQQRCLGKMGQVAQSGRTILFVSHNISAVHELCQRCLLLDHGQLVTSGETGTVINEYLARVNQSGKSDLSTQKGSEAWITDVRLICSEAEDSVTFRTGQSLEIEIDYETAKPLPHLAFGVAIEDSIQNIRVFGAVSSNIGQQLENVSGKGTARVKFPALHLIPGRYMISTSLNAKTYQYDKRTKVRSLDVMGEDELGSGWILSRRHNGVVWLQHQWLLES